MLKAKICDVGSPILADGSTYIVDELRLSVTMHEYLRRTFEFIMMHTLAVV